MVQSSLCATPTLKLAWSTAHVSRLSATEKKSTFEKRRTDDVERFQEDVSENVVVKIAPTLDTAECISLTRITIVEIDLIQLRAAVCQPHEAEKRSNTYPVHGVSDSEVDCRWALAVRVYPATAAVAVLRTIDLVVDPLDSVVMDKAERRASVDDRGIVAAPVRLPVYCVRSRSYLPEASRSMKGAEFQAC